MRHSFDDEDVVERAVGRRVVGVDGRGPRLLGLLAVDGLVRGAEARLHHRDGFFRRLGVGVEVAEDDRRQLARVAVEPREQVLELVDALLRRFRREVQVRVDEVERLVAAAELHALGDALERHEVEDLVLLEADARQRGDAVEARALVGVDGVLDAVVGDAGQAGVDLLADPHALVEHHVDFLQADDVGQQRLELVDDERRAVAPLAHAVEEVERGDLDFGHGGTPSIAVRAGTSLHTLARSDERLLCESGRRYAAGMHFKIAVLRGDGIGPEIADEALRVLTAVGGRFGHEFEFVEAYAGGEAWERYGEHLPAATLEACRGADAILKGPFGGPTSEVQLSRSGAGVETTAILGLRRAFDLFMNLRPVVVYPEMRRAVAAAAGDRRGRGHADRARADGRHLLRRARRAHGRRRSAQVWDTEAYTRGRDRAHHARRVQARARRAAST